MISKKLILIGGCVGVLAVVAAINLWPTRARRPRLDDASTRPQIEVDRGSGVTDEPLTKEKLVHARDRSQDELPWSRFRGPNGMGVSQDESIPIEWSETKNLRWKTELPGPGASSPILTEEFVFVTSYSGYGEDRSTGDMQKLQRHVSCIQRGDGAILWTRTFNNEQREDPYSGMGLTEHGYATNSPVTDGQMVFAFLGKSGVVAFDLDGTELWHVSVGTDSGNRGWGSAASLMLVDDLLIVNAAEEAHALVALDKATGKQVWNAEASTLELSYGTPALVRVSEDREDLVIAVPGEIWGLNPKSGKLIWFAQTSLTDNLSPSVIVDGTNIFAFGGYRSSGSLALRGGGKGNVTDSNVLWTSRNSSYVATPILVGRRLYWIDDSGMYFCANADTGELIHRARVPDISGGRPVYASPIAINGKIFVQTRTSGLFVIEPSEKFVVLAHNKFASDDSQFNATPAVDAGQLFLRSNRYLYCVSDLNP